MEILPTTVTGNVSLTATGEAASEPPTKVVLESGLSSNTTPVASVAALGRITVYSMISPGSAFPSPSSPN